MQQTVEKSTFEQRLAEIMPQLSKDQLRFVVASMEYPSKKEAAEAIGLQVNTVYKWGKLVDEAIELMAKETTAAALAIRRKNLIKAMAVKSAGLDSEDEGVRQKSATELIEWELGKSPQAVTVGNPDGSAIDFKNVIEIVVHDDGNKTPV